MPVYWDGPGTSSSKGHPDASLPPTIRQTEGSPPDPDPAWYQYDKRLANGMPTRQKNTAMIAAITKP